MYCAFAPAYTASASCASRYTLSKSAECALRLAASPAIGTSNASLFMLPAFLREWLTDAPGGRIGWRALASALEDESLGLADVAKRRNAGFEQAGRIESLLGKARH